MDLLHSLALGWQTALAGPQLLHLLIGCVLGTLIGVLPGVGVVAAIALLLPVMPGLDASSSLILLAAVYYGAQYGASTAAILAGTPGEAASQAAGLDGHQLARQGRAGVALAIAAFGSFFAGCVAALLIALLAQPLTELSYHFGPAEYFSLIVLGLVGAVVLASGSLLKALAMIVLGLLLAQVGNDAGTQTRFTFGLHELSGGIGFVAIAVGVFGFGDVIARLGSALAERRLTSERIGRLRPTPEDAREAWPAILRGTALGSLLGMLPGGGALLASFASYEWEKRAARQPRMPFGKGAIQGVAGPEAANNAGAQASFIPSLALGIPTHAVTALIAGALTLKGVAPGPQMMSGQPALFWGLIASMWIGNLLLLGLNLPLIGLAAPLLRWPYRRLFPALVAFGCIGLSLLHGRLFELQLGALFALFGYIFHKLGCEPAPLLLGVVLGAPMEENLRAALQLNAGDWGVFVTRPWSAGLLALAVLSILLVMLPALRSKREEAFQEDSV